MEPTEPYGLDDLKQIDRFPVLAKIGEGGFGVVYLAYDPLLGTADTARVAVKVLLSSQLEHRERFLQEAQLMRQLGSGIVEVHEFGEFKHPAARQTRPYFVMEYCERGTLADRLNGLARGLTFDEGVGLVEAIAASARTLGIPRPGHPNGIVHRDLKPSNFLIRRVEQREPKAVGDLLRPDEQLILADFSIAKSTEPHATALTLSGGTPGYAAPEQFFQEDTAGNVVPPKSNVDPTVDVYAASVVVLSAMSNSYRSNSAHYTDVDFVATGPFKRELKRAMSRNPRDRHSNFDHWRDALVTAYEQSRRNHRMAKIAAVALAIALLALGGWSILRSDDPAVEPDLAEPAPPSTGPEDSSVAGDEPVETPTDPEATETIEELETTAPPSEPFERCEVGSLDYDQPVHQIAFSSDGRLMATTSISSQSNVALWDTATGLNERILQGSDGRVIGVSFDGTDSALAVVDSYGTAHIWEIATGTETLVLAPAEATEMFRVAYTPPAAPLQLLATTGTSRAIRLWDAETGELVRTLTGHRGTTVGVAFHPNGERVASTSSDGTVRLWDLSNDEPGNILADHQAAVFDVAFNDDGSLLASSAADGETILWDTSGTRLEIYRSSNQGPSYAVAFSPDGKYLAVGSAGMVDLWDLQENRIVQSIPGYFQDVYKVAFNPVSGQLASVDPDGRVAIHCPTG